MDFAQATIAIELRVDSLLSKMQYYKDNALIML